MKHVRNGHRSAVSRLLNKFEKIKGDEESFFVFFVCVFFF